MLYGRSKLREFIDNLPGPKLWTNMVKFTILQTGNYKTFMQQCLSNNINLSHTTHGCVLRRRRGHGANSIKKASGAGDAMRPTGSGARRVSLAMAHSLSEYKTLTGILNWDRLARLYHRVIIYLYLYILVKYRLLDLISYDSPMKNFQYLDCFIPGRFRFVGRTNKISGEIASVFLFAFLVYRWVIHKWVPKFKFYAFEFIMSGYGEVVVNELLADVNGTLIHEDPLLASRRTKRRRPSSSSSSHSSFGPHEYKFTHNKQRQQRQDWDIEDNRASHLAHRVGVNSIYYLRSPFDLNESKWILRLNRTGDSWLMLSSCTKLIFYWAVLVLASWFVLMYYSLAGSILTSLGFEMSYSSCVSWLRDLQTAARATPNSWQNDYSHLYLAPRVVAHEIRIDDIPARIPLDWLDFQQVNLWSFFRILFDIIENHFIYLEFILIFIAQFYILALQSIDVILNATEIKRRLLDLLDKLQEQQRLRFQRLDKIRCYWKFTEAHSEFKSNRSHSIFLFSLDERTEKTPLEAQFDTLLPSAGLNWNNHHEKSLALMEDELELELLGDVDGKLSDEIADLQAILADHFDTITRGYNMFISFFVTFLSLIWLGYTVVICAWIGAIKSRAIEFEFLIAESGGTLFALILLSGTALVRSQNVQLYPLITRAMALDSDYSLTKPRWITIMSYFHPKPLYCFTIFGSSEISSLFCLKLISWILSAFVVLANFYYMNRL